MDFDDDRILNIDTADVRRLNAFKVPKKNVTSKSSFDKLSLDSSEFKDNIYPKIISSLKSANSCASLKILSAYNICNVEVESLFNKRKQYFKKEYSQQSAVEYFGYIYVSNLSELRKIVQQGRVKNGNIRESVLGQADMGVSVSQYADIYHPGDNKNCPRNGFLLIVKYIRGRVCFVVEDNTPMEPQPNYDCHISKLYSHESFPSIGRAFHTTQVYLYEYSDDLDLIEEPSHIIPWAAVEFMWGGPLPYKLANVPIVATKDPNEDPALKTADKRIRLLARTTGSPTQRMKQSYTDCWPILCTQMQLRLSGVKEETQDNIVLDLPVTVLSYHSYWSIYAPLMMSSWQVCELMEWISFEQEFLKPLIKNPLNENFSLNDVFNKRITISRHTENKLTSLVDSVDSQFINYLRLVVNDPSRDRAKMARLIDHFLETKTVGRIRLYDNSNALLYVFPDSTLSQNFGIPSVKTLDVNYLHVLLVTDKSLHFNQSSDLANEVLEMELKTNTLKLSSSQNAGSSEPLLPLFVLKQSLQHQNIIQKSKLREMCGSVTNVPMRYDGINFELVEEVVEPVVPVELVSQSNVVGVMVHDNGKEDQGDRPYDPSENLMGLSDMGSMKKVGQIRRTEVAIQETPPAKVLKREDKKLDLNNKLLQLFAKIEAPKSELDSVPLTAGLGLPEDNYQFDRTSARNTLLLDSNRFQTQFRHGVSVYIPQNDRPQQEESSHPRDRDLRFQDPINNSFQYSDAAMRHNGVNR